VQQLLPVIECAQEVKMVLLFWALSLFSSANASSFTYGDNDGDGVMETLPLVVEGPVVNLLKSHYCEGKGKVLWLPRDVIRTPAFLADQKVADDMWYDEDKSIWLGSLYNTWNDQTIFADIPRDYRLVRLSDSYRGIMHLEFAQLLRVSCPVGTVPVAYVIEEIPETTIKLGR
jgi:hypothetical protein